MFLLLDFLSELGAEVFNSLVPTPASIVENTRKNIIIPVLNMG